MTALTQRLVRPSILNLKGYSSARSLGVTGEVRLDANESPWPPYPGGEEAKDLNRYPDPQPQTLVNALASLYGVSAEQLFVGRGVDDAIDALVRCFCEAGRDAIVVCPPTYGMYEVSAQIQGAHVRSVPLRPPDFRLDPIALLRACDPPAKLVFVCSPNNPTGNAFAREELRELAEGLADRALLVVDEAYVEYSALGSLCEDVKDHENLVVLRTLSKAWGLAGARCGSAIGHPDLIALLHKVRAPYPLTLPSVRTVERAISSEGRLECARRVQQTVSARDQLMKELKTLPCLDQVFPSDANFVLVQSNNSALVQTCLEHGIIARARQSEWVSQGVRFSIGSAAENQRLLEVLRSLPAGREGGGG